jgi:dipeptidase
MKIKFPSLNRLFTPILVILLVSPLLADRKAHPDSCTSIMVGRLASVDGSVMTAHTCDGGYRTWLNIIPAATHKKGEQLKIYKGKMHNGFAGDLRGIVETGEIPQVKKTFAFINTAYPAMNEHQLGMGETTFGGRRELKSRKGIFYIEELQRLALERCKTAREAIGLIGKMIKKYGYCDSGECITIIDTQEVWQMEIMGPGKDQLGGVWAAVRIPDDHIGISANICRIGKIDLKDPDHFMASDNVFSLAKKMGWWHPKEGPFKFWKAYGASYRGKPFSIREFWVLSRLAPSLNLKYDAEELPFSVKPEKKVSLQDLMELYRTTYTGSEYDMTQNLQVEKRNRRRTKEKKKKEFITSPVANPWMSRHLRLLLNTLKPDVVKRYRPIAVEYCAYHTIIQARGWLPDAIGGIVWIGFDNPALTPKFPIFAGVTQLYPGLRIGSQKKFSRDSAAWAFRRASKLAMIRWDRTQETIKKTLAEIQDKISFELPLVDKRALTLYKQDPLKAKEFLSQYCNNFCRTLVNRYWEMGDQFWMLYGMGF